MFPREWKIRICLSVNNWNCPRESWSIGSLEVCAWSHVWSRSWHSICWSCAFVQAKSGMIHTDTCSCARLLSSLLANPIKDAVTEKMNTIGDVCTSGNKEAVVLTQDCHNHVQNVWIGAVVKWMSAYPNELLASYMKEMDFWLWISTMFDEVLRAIDKEFCLPILKDMDTCFYTGWDWIIHGHLLFLLKGQQDHNMIRWPKVLQLCIEIGGMSIKYPLYWTE